MRDILFRGKRKDNEKWVEGYYAVKTICSIRNTYLAPVICSKPKGLYDDRWFEIIPSTIGQYTGLKDKNGKKIFEGDIVKTQWIAKITEVYTVIYDDEIAAFCGKNVKDAGIRTFDDDLAFREVIGNIHDNPELLKNT